MRSNHTALKASLAFFISLILTIAAASAQNNPIKIGFVADFAHVAKGYSRSSYNAAKMAVAELNAQGGLLGRPVVLMKRDGGNDPESHSKQVEALARKEGVVAVFGGGSSPCILAASAAAGEQRIPYLISIGNTQSVVVEKGHPFVFLFEANSWMETKSFSIFTTLMPWRRYAWVGPDYIWGREVFGYFKQHFEEIDAPVEWVAEAWHPLDSGRYETLIQKIVDAKPDALLVASWGEDMRHFVIQAKSRGLFDKMAAFGWFFFMSGDTTRLLPEGAWTVTRAPFNYLAEKYPRTKRFVEKYFTEYGNYPIGFTICCYDSLIAWGEAVRKAESAQPESVAQALKGLSFAGLRGDSHIRAVDGQVNAPTYFGRLVYLPIYSTPVLDSVIEVPASKTWLSEKEVLERRERANRSEPETDFDRP